MNSRYVESVRNDYHAPRSATPQQRYGIISPNKAVETVDHISVRSNISARLPSQGAREIQNEERWKQITPQVVFFLMGVELERLKNENDSLAFKLKVFKDRDFEIENYKQQIKDLQLRLGESENIYIFEKEKFIEQTTILQQEVTKWRQQSTVFEQQQISAYKNEIESLRLKLRSVEDIKIKEREQLQSEMKMKIDQISYELHNSNRNQKEYLEAENKKLVDSLRNQNNEIESLKQRLSDAQLRKQQDEDTKILKSDLERVNRILTQKQEETEQWKAKYIHSQQYQDQLKQIQNENNQLRNSLLSLESECNDLRGACEQQQSDIEKLRQQLKARIAESDDIKVKLYKNEKIMSDFYGERNAQQNKMQLLENEIDRLQHIIRQKQLELETVSKKLKDMDDQIQYNKQDQQKIADLQRRLNDSKYQTEEATTRYKNLLLQVNQLNNQLKEKEPLEYQCREQQSQLDALQREVELLRNRLQELQSINNNLQKYEENIRVLTQEIDRLNLILNDQERELKQWRLQYADEGSLVRRNQDQLVLMVSMFTEVESLRMRMNDKELELEDLRRSSLAPFKIL